jgi:hypothetical protein
LRILTAVPGVLLRLVVFLVFVGASACFYVFLPGSPYRIALATGAVFVGLVVTVLLHIFLARTARDGPARIFTPLFLFALLMLFPASMQKPGEILYAREGLTVYGIVPVPALDIVIDADGWLRFREKTHELRKDEVQRLLGDLGDVDAIVIATGWQGQMIVDPLVNILPAAKYILPTEAAFEIYNRLRSEGKRVVLIAHTTC